MSQILSGNFNINDLTSLVQHAKNPNVILKTIFISLIFSTIIYFTYKASYDTLNYNKKFNTTLIMITFITTVLMELVQINLAVSLGMLGSLSLVRFRTNVKDTRDIGFIFWSIFAGLASATGAIFLCGVSSIILSILMITTSKLRLKDNKLLLVIRGQNVNLNNIEEIFLKEKIKTNIKAKNILSDSFELVYEINTSKSKENLLIDNLINFKGIDSVNLLVPNTEVA
ncbi:TPA: DUF4956 domain-containing protein [Clostridium perfringens]|uniref:DUF4956 domain-containing protein n=1 Tax=Clostridium perfringens TaxID=1502 RepID=A0A127EF78_CLOPF|nr:MULTISPECIES: DUF4956 domain-containing protein [Clostridium]AMN34606.1 hypothetical protein JFP838_02170 [Clostridium perfringens]EIW6614646.1 DUF4956 domain-containing protein [Clostridium perfringens]EJT6171483.1 DUF4956 domain-containing protein [Clostridium perfringens]EJT6542208.1 DUF4956 domain-containing protein [Clostridium perfringens]EJT6567216.1 DUF4956 domain-containing protein [Clostridium perfringens]